MTRLIDFIVVLAVAVVVLLPRPSVEARAALVGEPIDLDRVAELQDDLFRQPDDVDTAIKLAQAYLPFQRADWSLQVLGRFASRSDHRVHLMRAVAFAERLEPAAVVESCRRVEAACADAVAGKPGSGPPCSDGASAKATLLKQAMQSLIDAQVDPLKDPAKAKELVYKALHPGRYNLNFRPSMKPAP